MSLSLSPDAQSNVSASPVFLLTGRAGRLVCQGERRRVVAANADAVKQVGISFCQAEGAQADLLVGALPFDRRQPACLFEPQDSNWQAALAAGSIKQLRQHTWRHQAGGNPQAYAKAVNEAVQRIHATADAPLKKVVLARYLDLVAGQPVNAQLVWQQLARDPHATAFLLSLPLNNAFGKPRAFVGASPELLISRRGNRITSYPLAGSAKRASDSLTDQQVAASLQASGKDRQEHAVVVEAILDTLAPYCSELTAPETPELTSTDSMWHLGTPIQGTLKDENTPVIELAAALHPTPAVGGAPREQAAATIAELEAFDRGFYAGCLGWMNRAGEGDWYVSIRSAEIEGAKVRLYAGAGIVQASNPNSEVRETAAKFTAMLTALGIDPALLQGVLENETKIRHYGLV